MIRGGVASIYSDLFSVMLWSNISVPTKIGRQHGLRGIPYGYTRLSLMRNNYLEYLATSNAPGIAILAIEFGPFGNHIHILVINCR